jgi:hypothetical protein
MATSLINTECKRYGCIKNLLACYANCRYSTKCEDLRTEILDKTDQAASDINAYLSGRGRPPVTIQILKRGLKFPDVASAKKGPPAKAERQQAQVKNTAKSSTRLKTNLNLKAESQKVFSRPRRKQAGARAKLALTPAPDNKESASANSAKPVARIKKALSASYLEKNQALSSRRIAAGKAPRRKRKRVAKPGRARPVSPSRPAPEAKQKKSITMPRRVKNEQSENPPVTESVSHASTNAVESPAANKPKTPRARRRKRNDESHRPHAASRNGKLFIIVEGKSANIVDEQGLMQHLLTSPSPTARYFEASEVEARLHIVPKR